MIFSMASLISYVIKFSCEGITQINLVSERVAQLHPYKLFIPGPFDILFALTF